MHGELSRPQDDEQEGDRRQHEDRRDEDPRSV
jgi:hypothetical protein